MAVKSFRELEVWQVAMSLACDAYALLKQYPHDERYALCDQIRRSAVSVVSNIAEGFGRETTKDFIHFLAMARGSLCELDTQLELSEMVGYVSVPTEMKDKVDRVGMMLNALSAKLKRRLESNATSREPRATQTNVMTSNEIVLFKSQDGQVSLPVPTDGATVWLTQAQMALQFDKDRTVIGRHIRNAIAEGEIDPKVVCANFAHTTRHGAVEGKLQVQEFIGYNLDVVISVGYRVHSLRGVEFRRWATGVLKDYILHGYAINRKRLAQLGQAVEVMKCVSNSLDAEQVLEAA